jgi:short-subunit dehydrogenase involved in D-alanine esterification of teichoic acids
LDVTDQKSLDKFRDFIKNEHGGINVLVNNAAIAYKVSDCG